MCVSMQSIRSSFSHVSIDAQTPHTHAHISPALMHGHPSIHPLIAPHILPTCLSVSLLVRPPSKIATPTPTPTSMHTHSHAQRSSLPGAMSTRSVSLSLWCNSKTAALLNTPRQPLSPLPLSPTNRTRQTDRQASNATRTPRTTHRQAGRNVTHTSLRPSPRRLMSAECQYPCHQLP
mmetsp:Transcript_26797/g.76873  ORF Transcript_26797/g.76873 Transcript_26797/m.76873 type:complete len:177 (-) Transcript_26797:923-1453(-)